MSTAEIVNNTQWVLDVQVGNSVYFVQLAQLRRGATHTVLVDCTDTYQEYKFSPLGSTGSDANHIPHISLVVTSDDCCDYKRITISEVDGKLAVIEREPREYPRSGELFLQDSLSAPDRPVVPTKQCSSSDVGISSWKWWIRLRVF